MSLNVDGFTQVVSGGVVNIVVDHNHCLIKLAQKLPWDEMLELVLPDLQRTDKKHWWMGRPLRVRVHLGVYVVQQMFDLTDRMAEQQVRDNAAFRLFCGYGLLKKWHVPDHTKIEAFRSRLSPETQRQLANLISQHASRLGYANPSELDVDSTVQEANISYPALVNLLVKVAIMASTVGKGLNTLCHEGREHYRVGLTHLKQIALYYFNLKRKEATTEVLKVVQQRLWRETYERVLPILQNLYQLTDKVQAGIHWPLRRAMAILGSRGAMLLSNVHGYLFEGVTNASISSLHAHEVGCFNKGKLNKGLQFGRAFQLGRIGGNFLVVGQCSSLYMPDAQSLPAMLGLHQNLFGEGVLQSVATDKGYYSYDNEQLLIKTAVADIHLPRPERTLDAPPETTPWLTRKLLHDRRAGIEPLIGHTKHAGQMGRSRMKSDETTKSAGYAAVLGFNLRQLTRHITGEVRPKSDELTSQSANEAQIDIKLADSSRLR
ncbi:MAG: transposase [Legionella sp.]|uniref:transposase n=1 Tax=Legionella sp. TaxID=459 RepID=UPI0039E2CFB5